MGNGEEVDEYPHILGADGGGDWQLQKVTVEEECAAGVGGE